MPTPRLLFAALGMFGLLSPIAVLAGVNVGTVIALDGVSSTEVHTYECGAQGNIEVSYVNAGQNYLAILRIEDEDRIFAGVIAGSGARYVSGQYEWWTKGTDATLTDTTLQGDAATTTCTQTNDIP